MFSSLGWKLDGFFFFLSHIFFQKSVPNYMYNFFKINILKFILVFYSAWNFFVLLFLPLFRLSGAGLRTVAIILQEKRIEKVLLKPTQRAFRQTTTGKWKSLCNYNGKVRLRKTNCSTHTHTNSNTDYNYFFVIFLTSCLWNDKF